MPGDELKVEIEPIGPDHAQVRAFSAQVLEHAALRELLGRSEHRMIGVAPVDEPGRKTREPGREDLFRATIYDYTNDRTLEAVGRVGDPRTLEVEESARQPLPSSEELELAVPSRKNRASQAKLELGASRSDLVELGDDARALVGNPDDVSLP